MPPMATMHFTRAAYERLQAELDDLTTRGRIDVARKIEAARLLGDLSENGDYHAAKDEQGHMEGRIRELEHLLEHAEIIEHGTHGVAAPGSLVTVVFDGDDDSMAEQYFIGHLEERHSGWEVVSPKSPLGAALIGQSEGDVVSYQAANGTLQVKVLKVEHPE